MNDQPEAEGEAGIFTGSLWLASPEIRRGYRRPAPIETFTASLNERPTDLAGLRGARLVTAVETDEAGARPKAASRR